MVKQRFFKNDYLSIELTSRKFGNYEFECKLDFNGSSILFGGICFVKKLSEGIKSEVNTIDQSKDDVLTTMANQYFLLQGYTYKNFEGFLLTIFEDKLPQKLKTLNDLGSFFSILNAYIDITDDGIYLSPFSWVRNQSPWFFFDEKKMPRYGSSIDYFYDRDADQIYPIEKFDPVGEEWSVEATISFHATKQRKHEFYYPLSSFSVFEQKIKEKNSINGVIKLSKEAFFTSSNLGELKRFLSVWEDDFRYILSPIMLDSYIGSIFRQQKSGMLQD